MQKAVTCRTCVSWHTMGARLRLVIVGGLASTIAAKKADGCSATATYPDGTEIERCVAISSSAATPSRTHLFSLKCARSQHIIASRVYAYRSECMVIGEGGSRGAKAEAPKKGISEEMAWLKDTRWLWNDWREVSIRVHARAHALDSPRSSNRAFIILCRSSSARTAPSSRRPRTASNRETRIADGRQTTITYM